MTSRGLIVALMLSATAMFVVGVSLERHETHSEAAESPAQRAAEGGRGATSATPRKTGEKRGSAEIGEPGKSGESGESAEHTESTEPPATTITTAEPATEAPARPESSEKLLGVDPESTGLLVAAVAISLLLAGGVWWMGASPLVLGVVALVMAAFGALDIREVVHQADESRTGLMLLAGLVALLHLAAAALAARAAVATRGPQPPPVSANVR